MKTLAIVMVVAALPAIATAVIDSDPDLLGIYFDTQADINCQQADAGLPFAAYVILTNPTQPGIDAFEFGYDNRYSMEFAGMLVLVEQALPSASINVGAGDADSGFLRVGMASPVPASTATVLVTWQFIILAGFPVQMYLGPADLPALPDGLPVIVGSGDGELLAVDVRTGDTEIPVAMVNGACGVKEEMHWGTIKSAFR